MLVALLVALVVLLLLSRVFILMRLFSESRSGKVKPSVPWPSPPAAGRAGLGLTTDRWGRPQPAITETMEKPGIFMAADSAGIAACGPPPDGKAYILTRRGWVMVDIDSDAYRNAGNSMT